MRVAHLLRLKAAELGTDRGGAMVEPPGELRISARYEKCKQATGDSPANKDEDRSL